MALTFLGTFTCSIQDLANLMGVSTATVVASIATSQTNAALSSSLYTGSASPFTGIGLTYTTGATIGANDIITISLASGFRSGFNARRIANAVERIQNFQSSGFLTSNTAPNGMVVEAQ